MTRFGRYLALMSGCMLLAACGGMTGPRVASLPASPTKEVDRRTLGPMTLDPARSAPAQTAAATDPAAAGEEPTGEDGTTAEGLAQGAGQGGTGVAALGTPPPNADTAAQLGRSDLLGGWKIASGPDQCQLFMNLTAWQGGYRATTRGCSSPALQNIAAWDLNGNQVTLKDGNGAAIGSAFPTGNERFAGQTAGGQQIAFFR